MSMQAASGKIQDARDKADSKLKGAKDAVSAAETKLKIAQTAFDSAEAQVPLFSCVLLKCMRCSKEVFYPSGQRGAPADTSVHVANSAL